MSKTLEISANECTGCMSCTLTCSFMKTGTFSYKNALIKIIKKESEAIHQPLTCSNCGERKCVASCAFDAIQISIDFGIPVINPELCTGCRQCVQNCDNGIIKFYGKEEIASKCDFCGGSPACAAVCIPGAIKLISN